MWFVQFHFSLAAAMPACCGILSACPCLDDNHTATMCQGHPATTVLCCRAMRKWDEDGQPDVDAVEFGEFLIKV
jgi:hypothetical protein